MPQPENPVAHQPVTQAMRDRSRWHRRTGRGTLRLFRPLFAPLLTRLQSRFQTAIEDSTVPSRLRRIEAMLDDVLNSRAHVERYPELGGTVVATLAAMRSGIERMQVDIDRLSVRMDLVQLATDGSLLSQNEFRQVVQAGMPRLLAQVSGMHMQIDHQHALIEQVSARHSERLDYQHVSIAEKLDHQQTLLAESRAGLSQLNNQVSAMHVQVDHQHSLLAEGRTGLSQLIGQVSATHSQRFDHQLALSNETLEMATSLVTKCDLLLRRFAFPMAQDVLVRTSDGYVLIPRDDPALMAIMFETAGRMEPGTVAVITALLQEGDYAIDVGANVGLTVLPAARKVGPRGRVIAVEPGSRAAGLLRRTLAINALTERVALHACAAGAAHGVAHLNIGLTLGHSSLLALPGSEQSEEVEVRTIDSLVTPGTRVRFAKLDAEGFEPQVWRGMERVISENPDLAVLLEFGPEHLRRANLTVEDWFSEFLAPGFTAYEVDEATGHLRTLRPRSELATVFSVNLLLLRQRPGDLPELHFE